MTTNDILLLGGIGLGVIGVFGALALLFEKMSRGEGSERWGSGGKKKEKKPRKTRKRSSSGPNPLAKALRSFAGIFRMGDTSQSKVQELLVHAGIRDKGAVEVFLGAKFALAAALPAAVVALLLWRGKASGSNVLMYGSLGLVAGLLAPNLWLKSRAKKRIEKIRLSLPDALDLLIVCVESGLGLDAALVRISKELENVAPEFCEELRLLNLEVSAGKPREECLRNLALRTGCEEVESLTARINQAARYGTNLGHSLRIHSESLRQKRRQQAEERAAKTTIKLLFPLVFFIFPAIFVVILGPAAAKVAEQFL